MSNLAPQKINLSYSGLLQVPGGLTSSLQYITDGNGVSSGLQISTTGFSGAIASDTVTITGGTINGTAIGATNPSSGRFSSLTVSTLTGLLKGLSGAVSTATANTDYLTPPSGTAILKANLGGALANATSGVDYAPATSGSSVLSGNGSGGFTNVSIGPGLTFVGSTISTTTGLDNTKLLASNGLNGFTAVTVGSGLQYSGGVLASTSGGGSVTTVSVVSANGFTGTVANASSTPAITLTTSVTGLLKGNGTAISAAAAGSDYLAPPSGTSILKANSGGALANAVAGTDYPGLSTTNTFTANQTISGNLTASALIPSSSTIPINGLFLPTTNTLAWSTNSTERMRLDSSGNLGLGVTPSGWYSTAKVIDINNTGSVATFTDGGIGIYSNTYLNSSAQNIYKTSRYAGYYQLQPDTGKHVWSTAPSGTAGNAISFTQAMTLDASGNLLVGTTSSDAKLVSKSGSTTVAAARFDTGVAGDVGQSPVYVVKYDNNTTTSQGFIKFFINSGGAASGVITANGANAATFTSTSDARLKENITALPNQLANICALKPSEFDYKDGSGHQIGFIAQEMQEVYSDCVAEDGDGMLMISGWSKTEARLVKAIQEIAARLDVLEAK